MFEGSIDTYLEHYGKKGMKWGVVKKQGTPGTSDADKREQKAQKYITKANEYQKNIDYLNARPVKFKWQQNSINEQIAINEEKKKTALADAELKRQGKLSTTQKQIAIGAGVAAAALAVWATYNAAQSGEINRMATRGKAFLQGKRPEWKLNSNLSRKDMSEEEIMSNIVSKINPDFGGMGTSMNCRRCTFAYEMRRRGYDVAATKTTNARGQDFTGVYNAVNPGKDFVNPGSGGVVGRMIREKIKGRGGKPTPFTDAVNSAQDRGATGENVIVGSIIGALKGQPNGARGELEMQWKAGGGHSIAWEIIGGKPVLFDTQTGKKFIDDDIIGSEYPSIAKAAFTRLDDKVLNPDFLMRWLKDA
jgi:hypothetical protein